MKVFDYSDYKAYLAERIPSGSKSKLAQYIGCQPSFLSQVIRGKPNLSLEQAVLVNEFLEHGNLESHFFIGLVQIQKAGSPKLKKYFQDQINEVKQKRASISSRVTAKREISEQTRGTYYYSWIYPVIHVLVSIPVEHQLSFLREKTGLPRETIEEVLNFLESIELIKKKNTKYTVTQNRVHLKSTERAVLQHHRNFRLKALTHLEAVHPENLHYSSVIALSREDTERLRAEILKLIENSEEILAQSPEEIAYGFCIDFFAI
jgi:uncharacterized protein (TIGR02147 family)